MKNLLILLLCLFCFGCATKIKLQSSHESNCVELQKVIYTIENTPIPNEISEELFNFASASPELFASTLRQVREAYREDILRRVKLLEKPECVNPPMETGPADKDE